MLVSTEKLKEWAAKVEPTAAAHIAKFLMEAETLGKKEVESAKACLHDYGYKVYESPYHMKEG